MKRLLAGAATLLTSLALAAPAAYDVFPETRSPGGRWAVGWGVPGKTLDSKKLRSPDAENPYFEGVMGDSGKAEDYLIDLKAGKIPLDQKRRDAPISGRRIGVGEQQEQARFGGVCDPQLAAGEQETVSIFHGPGSQRKRVGAGPGLR